MNGNGNKILWWITGSILAPMVLAVTTMVGNTTLANANRLSALERDTEHRLQQIERKLDRLLEKDF